MAIPIVFFHYSNPKYLKYSLKQARHYNPDSDIYLLGDDKNNRYPFVKHINAAAYTQSAEAFKNSYIHRSSNGEFYELFCFLRWFYIEAFCREQGIEEFIYLDSDVLLFENVTALKPYLEKYHIANTAETAGLPAFTYFKNYAAIKDFCSYLLTAYTNPQQLKELEAIYQPFAAQPGLEGGISDMTLFHLYFRDHPDETGKIDLVTDSIAIDSNISVADGYETEDGIKKIYWQNGLPYGRKLATGKLIRFASLHYQGFAKALMAKHFNAPGYKLKRLKEIYRVTDRIRAVREAFKKGKN